MDRLYRIYRLELKSAAQLRRSLGRAVRRPPVVWGGHAMSTSLNHAEHRPHRRRNGFAHPLRSALAAASLALLLNSMFAGSWARADEPVGSSEEDSLLVATHDQTVAEPAAVDSSATVLESSATDQPLEPVSDFSEPTPELAEGESQSEEAASQFADALAKVAQPPQADATPDTSRSSAAVRVSNPSPLNMNRSSFRESPPAARPKASS